MSRKLKLLEKAWNNSNGLTFDELCRLAEYAGYGFERQRGTSHRVHKNPSIQDKLYQLLNIQRGKNGEAKQYQVKQLLEMIEKYDLM